MAEFLLASPEPVEWSLNADRFAAHVLDRWPGADVRGVSDGRLLASAWIRAGEPWDDTVIELHPNGSTIGIDSRSYPTVSEIACWWRAIVPSDVPVLWLFDRGFSGYSAIGPDATPADVFGSGGG